MSSIFSDKEKKIEIHKSLNSRSILTSRKRFKLAKIKKIKKIKKKFLRIHKIKKDEKNDENNIDNTNKEHIIFNHSYPNILEKENLIDNNFKLKLKFNKLILNETPSQNEPKNIINNIYNKPIKKIEDTKDNNVIHNISKINDNNSQNNNNNIIENIPSLSNDNKNNNNFENFVPNEFTYGNFIEPFEINSFSENMTYHESPFVPRILNFNEDNNLNNCNLFPEYQDTILFNNDKADDYFNFSIPDSFSFNSSNNQNNISYSPFSPNLLINRNNNFYCNNNFNNDTILRNNSSFRHNNFNNNNNILRNNSSFKNNVLNNNINLNINYFNFNYINNGNNNNLNNNRNNNIINNNRNNNYLYSNIHNNVNINNNFNNRNNNNINSYINNASNINGIDNNLNRLRNLNSRSNYYHFFEAPLNYYSMRKIRINKIKENLTKSKIKNIKNLEDNKKSCIICLEEFKNRQMIYTLPCSHIFHVICLNKEIKLRQKCPICRKVLKY